MNLVTRIKFGSHLYGTNTPSSDTDYKSVYLPEARDILLQRVQGSVGTRVKQRVQGSVGTRVKQRDGEKNTPDCVDDEAYSLQRYLELLAQGQTVAIDMLFAPAPQVTTGLWRAIQANKHRLLTKKSAAFVGYCRQQANKYGIKGSRVAAAKQAVEFFAAVLPHCGPNTKLVDVQVSMIKALVDDTNEHTSIEDIETTNLHFEKFFVCCNRKVSFNNTVKQAHEVFSKIYANYGARAKLAEGNEGVDWKALSHAVRVGHEALELLRTGKITFPLPYAAEIVRIKQGLEPYGKVVAIIESLLKDVEEAGTTSLLRDTADQEFIDDLVACAYRTEVEGWA